MIEFCCCIHSHTIMNSSALTPPGVSHQIANSSGQTRKTRQRVLYCSCERLLLTLFACFYKYSLYVNLCLNTVLYIIIIYCLFSLYFYTCLSVYLYTYILILHDLLKDHIWYNKHCYSCVCSFFCV